MKMHILNRIDRAKPNQQPDARVCRLPSQRLRYGFEKAKYSGKTENTRLSHTNEPSQINPKKQPLQCI